MFASNRLLAAGLLGIGVALSSAASHAQEWKKKFPVVGFSSVSSENQAATQARYKQLADVFREKLGVELRIFTATDYAGTVQALTSGQIQMAQVGASAYAAAWIDSNGQVEPLVTNQEVDGSLGYHSILIVKADSPFKRIEDLKGRSLAWADPNSTSGFLIPLVSLRAVGIEPDKFFGKTLFSGGHEQSVLGVINGQFDSGFTWSSKGHNAGQIRAMVDRGVLKMDQFRVIWESPLIPNPLVIVRKDLPADMRRDLLAFWTDLAKTHPQIAELAARGKTAGFVPATHEMYKPVLDAALEVRKNRKR
ncbi:MAG: phosphonate ABC transporter substrate-binding protein [Rhodocyclaceae bacterium]|nr:phosphonate ABC transporter substrate-binding protein [Rhodocyclaceae bacterium]MCA3075730.1 phosphonate ABC transporter substrate-binding protein [Rhodocyclaceae bacterium]MCA3089915.1 phosphonate ABC transporter substrate-binding protein [Rhodocyclaceae bacterium]MCA3093563.1 phosphonate ABC transporter substrate-binding protein [Rhodocyclaceae bacterium]MCA3096380.1 phosphonate ABC transporter substrate-binding protein [Rhodocyclaceae bacterium]